MVDLAQVGLALSIASAIALGVLGLLLLALGPRRAHVVAFSLFLLLWSGLLIPGNLAGLYLEAGRVDAAQRAILLHIAVMLVAYVPLVYFAGVYPERRATFAASVPGALALATPAFAGVVAFLVQPELFHRGFQGASAASRSNWGPLYPLALLTFFAAFYYAIFRLDRHRRRSTNAVERRRTLLVLAALSVYVAYESAENLALFGWPLVSGTAGPNAFQAVLFTALSIVGLAVIGRVLADGLAGQVREDPHGRLAVVTVVVPAAFGIASAAARLGDVLPSVQVVGLFRLASVILLAWALLRFEVYDLDLRVKRAAVAAGLAGLLALAAFAALAGAEALLGADGSASAGAELGVLALLALLLVVLPGTAARIADRVPPHLHAEARLADRRLEVYEAALSREVQRVGPTKAAQHLRDLRSELDITESEHRVVSRLVVPPTSTEANGDPFLPGEVVAGRYRIGSRIGEGATGEVFLAIDLLLDRPVVIKALHGAAAASDEQVRRFLREARAAAGLEHGNVVRVYDFGYEGAVPYFVQEYCTGGSLQTRLEDEKHLPAADVARLLDDVLAGLAHIHEHGFLHRDLKPANILLTSDGRAKISDFGLAVPRQLVEGQDGDQRRPLGTPAYMSPEAATGGRLSLASDLYAVGALAYQLLTGGTYLDFDTRDPRELRRRILEEEPRRPSRPLADEVEGVLRRSLAKDPTLRHQSADELRDALASAFADDGVTLRGRRGETAPRR